MSEDCSLKPTYGIEGGLTVQFAEGHWPDLKHGVSIDEEVAFELLRPILLQVVPGFRPPHWYETFQLSTWDRSGLVGLLRKEAAEAERDGRSSARSDLLAALAD